MRKYYLDNIRWMTVVTVVLYHVIFMYNDVGIVLGPGKITGLEHQYYDIFLYMVYPWLMPVLYIVSGICSRLYLEKHTDKEFLRSRTAKLLVPGTIGLLAFQFIQGYLSISLGTGLDSMSEIPKPILFLILAVSGTGPLWYIQLLWIFSILLIPVRKLEKDRLWEAGRKCALPILILLVIPVWLSAQILNTPMVNVYRFGLYGAVFFLGYFVFSHDEVIEILKKFFYTFLAVSCALCIAFCLTYFGQNYADAPVYKSVLFVAYGWFACMTIIGGTARYGDVQNSFTRWMGKHSFGLYVFHYLGISAVALYVAKPALLPPFWVYVLSLIAGFAAGYILDAVISGIPYYRWAVLGKEK